jgi:uncharacterized protein (DUF305 family)
MRSLSRMSVPALLGASILVGLSFLAGCGSGSDNNATAQTTRNQTVPPFIPNGDVQYIDAIVPHHQMALEMAQMELDKGTRADVKALAQTIKDMQTSEIALLKSARQALTGQAEIPTPPTDAHMEKDMADMRAMAAGPMVDEMFLDDMIPHHSEAISLAHRALPSLSRADVKDNATNVISGQAKEIGEMQTLRGGM